MDIPTSKPLNTLGTHPSATAFNSHFFDLDLVFFISLNLHTLPPGAMEDQSNDTNSPSQGSERVEPVRSRWTPKPEQILILESIFNSGMVNPPKDETVRIRKLLEKFGSVGDANVFYWFQNRRSRSRRRQRQIQAGLAGGDPRIPPASLSMSAIQSSASSSVGSFASPSSSSSSLPSPSSSSCFVPPPSCVGLGNDVCSDLFSISQQMGLSEIEQAQIGSAMLWSSDDSNLHYQPG